MRGSRSWRMSYLAIWPSLNTMSPAHLLEIGKADIEFLGNFSHRDMVVLF